MSQPGWLGSLRIASLYLAGVVLGGLGGTIIEPDKYLVGASAGVYALILAHLGKQSRNLDLIFGAGRGCVIAPTKCSV